MDLQVTMWLSIFPDDGWTECTSSFWALSEKSGTSCSHIPSCAVDSSSYSMYRIPLLWGWLINEGGGNHTVNTHIHQTSIVHEFSFECAWTLCVNPALLHACLCLLHIPYHWSADNRVLQDRSHRPQTPTPRLFWQLIPRNTSHVTPGNERLNVCMCCRGGDSGNAAAWSSADLRLLFTDLESLD